MIVRSETNCFINGRALVYGEVAELDDSEELDAALRIGLVVELDDAGGPIFRAAAAPARSKPCCGG